MGEKLFKLVYWAPRVLTILFLCFLALFSLDVFEPGLGFWQVALGLLMHNLPVLVLAAVLAVSWKRELVGGVVFTAVGVLFGGQMVMEAFSGGRLEWPGLLNALIIAGPALVIGVLFLVGWREKRKRKLGFRAG